MIVDEHYRVVIFGSARIKEGDKIYQDVFAISKGLAEYGYDIVTGGGPGLMLAANSGHKSANSGTHSLVSDCTPHVAEPVSAPDRPLQGPI